MAKELALRRHTDNDGDVLTPEGVVAALEIGRPRREDEWRAAYAKAGKGDLTSRTSFRPSSSPR